MKLLQIDRKIILITKFLLKVIVLSKNFPALKILAFFRLMGYMEDKRIAYFGNFLIRDYIKYS